MDSQSVKTTAVGGREQSFGAAKKVKGRKRHLVVDTLGLAWAVVVDAASMQDQLGAWQVFGRLVGICPGLEIVFGEASLPAGATG
ncbi:MAG: hypothetical protein RMJ16_14050 [Thermoguttaceae bacterium]|nr:hypothetical protein [Thermoguttaceae bacterium]